MDLCIKCLDTLFIGTVESVSLHGIVLSSVFSISGGTATVKPLPSPHVLKATDRFNSPKMIPGKTYFFNDTNLFIAFNHGSVLQSLHFIISKCTRKN